MLFEVLYALTSLECFLTIDTALRGLGYACFFQGMSPLYVDTPVRGNEPYLYELALCSPSQTTCILPPPS